MGKEINKTYTPKPKGAKIIIKGQREGLSPKEIAEETGYALPTVYYYLHKYADKDQEKLQRYSRIVEQLKNGMPQSIIARRNKVSRQYVSSINKKLKVKND